MPERRGPPRTKSGAGSRSKTLRSGPLAVPVILLLRFRRQFRHFGLHLAIPRQHALKTAVERLGDIEGIVLLDGTWSQAKALWWRNAWMLKCQRVILGPERPSRYGKLRKEPRRDGLSTIEAAGMLLAGLEKRPDIAATLHASFERLLARYLEVQAEMPELAPKPKKKDYRRRKRA